MGPMHYQDVKNHKSDNQTFKIGRQLEHDKAYISQSHAKQDYFQHNITT